MKKFISLVVLVGLGVLAAYLINLMLSEEDVAPDDSSALYGGVTEYGYPSAGYVLTQTDQGMKTCGYSVIDQTTAITAAHCVDDATSMSIGKGVYEDTREEAKQISRAVQKEGWVKDSQRSEDFALLYFDNTDKYFDTFSQISSPERGCDYRVVAYGRTELPEDPPMLRKSAQLCITEITSKTFTITGTGDSGICFGDSGSPIYKDGTNQVVGVIASIINKVPNDPNPCNFGNTAIAVRADTNQSLIANSADEFAGEDIAVAKEFTIEVANSSFLDEIGLNNIDKRDVQIAALTGSITGATIAVIYLIADVFKGMSKKDEISNKGAVFN